MAQNFLACDREQPFLLPPDVREWLPQDHFAWFVIETVAALDLSAFYAAYRLDGHGRAAYEPTMMLALLVYAYSIGERSSRAIERRCIEDIAFRVICANHVPDHATVARFRVRHETALGELFAQVLGLCARAGLVDVGVVAVDGTKVAAMASERATRSYAEIAREILEEAGRVDAAEDALHGEARGDELPRELATREGRQAWLQDAKRRLEQERAQSPEPIPRERLERLEICRRRLVEDWRGERQANREYEAYRARGVMKNGRRFGKPPNPYEPPASPAGRLNVTDPDARNMKSARGFVFGYNAQLVAGERQIIIAAEIAASGSDFDLLGPMVRAAQGELQDAGISDQPGVVLADAGYWSNTHIDATRAQGMTPIVAVDAHTRTGSLRNRRGGPYDFMRRVLASPAGGTLYARRQAIVEPIFGQIKTNRGIGRFRRRGHAAVRSEWRLITATHNVLKLHRHGLAAATG